MKSLDSNLVKYSAIVVILVSVIYNLLIKHLITEGYSASSLLLYRGIFSFCLVICLSVANGQKIIPTNKGNQLLRIILAGTSLLLLFQSYKYLSASTVFLIGRLDIPFAIFVGLIVGTQKVNFKVWLSILSLLAVLLLVFYLQQEGVALKGLLLAIASVMLVAICYLIIKKSTTEENNFVLVNINNIGCVTVGLLSGILFNNLNNLKLKDWWLFLLAAIAQVILNYTAALLYRKVNVERVQRPYLIAAIFVLFAEQIWTGNIFSTQYLIATIAIVAIIYLITLKQLTFTNRFKKQ